MSTAIRFDPKDYLERIFRLKGHAPESNPDIIEIMRIQWPSWKSLFERHRLPVDSGRAETLLTDFGPVQTYGPASIIEAFSDYLDAKPKTFVGGPDWAEIGRTAPSGRCPYCDGRGIVSDIPVQSATGRYQGVRHYSFRCCCFAAIAYGGTPEATPQMLEYAQKRHGREADKRKEWLKANGFDFQTESQFRADFRRWLEKQKGGMFKNAAIVSKKDPVLERIRIEQKVAEIQRTKGKAIESTSIIDDREESNPSGFPDDHMDGRDFSEF